MVQHFTYTPNPDIAFAVIMLHPGCNMTCTFCVTDNSFSSMTWKQATHLLDRFEGTAIEGVVLGGGEPLTWEPGVFELAQEAKHRGFHVQIGTNGIALPDDFVTIESVDRYVLPLDAIDEDLHDTLRIYRKGHYSVIMDRLEKLRAAGKAVTVSTVVTQQNKDSLPDLAAFLSDYTKRGGALHAWHLYKFVPEGRGGKKNAHALYLSNEEYDQACAQARQIKIDCPIYKRKDMFNSKTVDFFWAEGDAMRACSQTSAVGTAQQPLHTCETYTFLPQPA